MFHTASEGAKQKVCYCSFICNTIYEELMTVSCFIVTVGTNPRLYEHLA